MVEGNESYSVALSAPATNAAGANVALGTASVTTTIIDNDTQTFSLTEGNPTVSEGSADSYTVHLTNPIDPGVTVSVNIAITLPGGLGGAAAADFTNAFLADIDTAIASTTGVTRSGTTLTFDSTFNAAAGFSFTLPTVNDTLVEGNESYSVALSAPTSNTATASVASAPVLAASPPPSSTTTRRPSRSPKAARPSARAAPTATPSISPTRSIPASPSASTSPSPCRADSAALRRRISPMPSWPTFRRR